MVAARVLHAPQEVPDDADQRLVMSSVSWWQYETMLAIRGDNPAPRMTYLEGALELMSPSRSHENLKTLMARLLESYADVMGVELEGYGALTMRSASHERGLEPDECYAVGGVKEYPDLAIEVIWTSGGIDKLEVYKSLEIKEVWMWKRQRLSIYVLRGHEYVEVEKSEVLPGIDIELLASFLDSPSQTQAVRAYRQALLGRKE
jgi:Uma2 family endonuclease